jgi:hypothetical protein
MQGNARGGRAAPRASSGEYLTIPEVARLIHRRTTVIRAVIFWWTAGWQEPAAGTPGSDALPTPPADWSREMSVSASEIEGARRCGHPRAVAPGGREEVLVPCASMVPAGDRAPPHLSSKVSDPQRGRHSASLGPNTRNAGHSGRQIPSPPACRLARGEARPLQPHAHACPY